MTKLDKKWSSRQHKLYYITNIYERDGQQCFYCQRPMLSVEILKDIDTDPAKTPGYPTLDHKIPKSVGGPTTLDNLVVACFSCNQAKGNNSKFADPSYLNAVDIDTLTTAQLKARLQDAVSCIRSLRYEITIEKELRQDLQNIIAELLPETKVVRNIDKRFPTYRALFTGSNNLILKIQELSKQIKELQKEN